MLIMGWVQKKNNIIMYFINLLLSKFVLWYLNLPNVKSSNLLLEPTKIFLKRADNFENLSDSFRYCFGDLTAMYPPKEWAKNANNFLIENL